MVWLVNGFTKKALKLIWFIRLRFTFSVRQNASEMLKPKVYQSFSPLRSTIQLLSFHIFIQTKDLSSFILLDAIQSKKLGNKATTHRQDETSAHRHSVNFQYFL